MTNPETKRRSVFETDEEIRHGLRVTKSLQRLRHAGWYVVAHEDYKRDGVKYTGWFFAHPSGVWVKGESDNDADALMVMESEAMQRFEKFGIK